MTKEEQARSEAVRRAAIVRDVQAGMSWDDASKKYHIPKSKIQAMMTEELATLRKNARKPLALPAEIVDTDEVGGDEGVFAGSEPPPWDEDGMPRRTRGRSRQQFTDEPGEGEGHARRSRPLRPDGVFSAGESRHGIPNQSYGPAERKHLLDRTFEAYANLLDESAENMNAKELLTMAEVFKLLDTQARLSEGRSTDNVQVSDNRDAVRAQIDQIKARKNARMTPPPVPPSAFSNEVVA